jgi:hypothetical protein
MTTDFGKPRPYTGEMHLEGEVWNLQFFVKTNSSGVPINIDDGTVTDQDGDALHIPKEVESVTKVRTGLYRVLLKHAWEKILFASAEAEIPNVEAEIVGTVDASGLTLSTLNTTTLKVTASDGGGETVVTFTTPSSVQDIADQLNTALIADTNSARAEIVTTATKAGAIAKYVRLYDSLMGSASALSINATSTADTILGLTGTASGQDAVKMTCVDKNPKPWTLGGAGSHFKPARTVTFACTEDTGVAANVVSGGFNVLLKLKNSTLP